MQRRDPWKRSGYALLLTLAGCSPSGFSGGTSNLFVAPGARGSGDGSSWDNATGGLQDALMHAQPGQEIWVQSGTYRPAEPGATRDATFMLPEGVVLRGGFRGDETSLAERDPQNLPSILDGDLDGDDGSGFANRSDNCYHVLTAHMVEQATLENFTVRGGYADGPALGAHVESGDQGSGLQVFHAHPHVVNCFFTDNWSENHGTVNDHGGGIWEDCVFSANYAGALGAGLYFHGDIEAHAYRCRFLGNSTPGQGGGAYSRSFVDSSFEDCIFVGNHAERGAGMYMAEGSSTTLANGYFDENIADVGGGGLYIDHATGLVQGCTFIANEAGHDVLSGGAGAGGSGGGGIWTSAGSPTVEDCVFDSNVASFGGGIYHNDTSHAVVRRCDFYYGQAFEAGGLYTLESPVTVEDCSFYGNTASGGAFSVGGGMSLYFSEAHVRRCDFVGNSAELGGGGAYVEGSTPALDDCSFQNNSANGDTQGWGGGLMAGYFTQARITNSLFASNQANRGGAVFAIAFAEPMLVNATLVGNRATQDGGGILAFASSNLQLSNSIVWHNLPEQIAGIDPTLAYDCIERGATGIDILDLDPRFVALPEPGLDGVWGTLDDLPGDLNLLPGSPCRDAGDNTLLLPEEALDLDGHARFVDDPFAPDTGAGTAPIVDLGAYEAGSSK